MNEAMSLKIAWTLAFSSAAFGSLACWALSAARAGATPASAIASTSAAPNGLIANLVGEVTGTRLAGSIRCSFVPPVLAPACPSYPEDQPMRLVSHAASFILLIGLGAVSVAQQPAAPA